MSRSASANAQSRAGPFLVDISHAPGVHSALRHATFMHVRLICRWLLCGLFKGGKAAWGICIPTSLYFLPAEEALCFFLLKDCIIYQEPGPWME